MRRLAFVFIVLCSAVTACRREDTTRPEKWPRTTEARVTNAGWRECSRKDPAGQRVVHESTCPPDDPPPDTYCDDDPTDHRIAVRMLVRKPRCTDTAVAVLEGLARDDKEVLSDLAAAYYTRAVRDDAASDLLRAYEKASEAVANFPDAPAPRFNLALAQEAIGMDEQAVETWRRIPRADDRGWKSEADARRKRLQDRIARRPQFDLKALHAALAARDASAVARAIAPAPKSAMRELERQVRENADGDTLRLFAAELSRRLGNDPYPLHLAAAASRSAGGHAAFKRALALQTAFEHKRARETFVTAATLLEASGSPLYLEAERRRAIAMVLTDADEAIALLERIEAAARTANYRYLLHTTIATRGYALFKKNSYLPSLEAYEVAKAYFEALSDAEALVDVYAANIGTYREMGQYEISWRESQRGLVWYRRAAEPAVREKFIGEIAQTAARLGVTRASLAWQKGIVADARRRRAAALAAGDSALARNQSVRLGIALRELARFELQNGDYVSGRTNILEAIALPKASPDDVARDVDTRRLLDLRAAEVQGHALLEADPAAAAAAFTRALQSVEHDDYSTFRAGVLVQRADAHARLNRPDDAERDLRRAIADLRKEEARQLAGPERDQGEPLWSRYFSRFDEAYRTLAAHLVARGRHHEAFDYAERARAYELLDRVRKQPFTPAPFLALTQNGDPIRVADLQANLPRGVFLLQYCLTDDRLHTWIVSNGHFEVVSRAVRRDEIRSRSETLRYAATHRLDDEFIGAARFLYDDLLRDPLARARELNGGRPPQRIVIVPDDAMHGVPFSALQNPDTLEYLVQETTIEIAISATLYVLAVMRREELGDGTPTALLVGNPKFDKTLPLAAGLEMLPVSEKEVLAIRSNYEPDPKVLRGDAATVPEFLRHAPDKSVIHFAGHAIVSAKAPWSSLLLLAPSGGDRGVLEAGALLRLKLDRTRLVVLASCSTAGGLPVGAEGVAPLVRPFIANGVPAVVGTLWDVIDATTHELFVSFHRDYRKHGDAAAALRNAQLALLEGDRKYLQSPTLWGPFQVIGH